MLNRQLIRRGAVSAIPLLGLLLGVLIFQNSRCSAPNENDPHVVELKKLAGETPVYERFQKTGEKVVVKSTLIYYFVYYRGTAKFPEVRVFYDRALREKGWTPPQPDPGSALTATYRRGDYEISVEQSDRETDHFDLVFKWDPE
ncbi:MAG TPA: hypothetical protein VGD61_23820 [Pyrinomonadaceae bacterium]